MVGVGVDPPAPPAAVAPGLHPRALRPRRVSAKRTWPPGCGRFPAPPPAPAPAAAAGGGEKGADGAAVLGEALDGRADAAAAPATAASPPAQNGVLPRPGLDKAEQPVDSAAVSPVAENGAPPQGRNMVAEATSPANPAGQAVDPAAVLPVAQSGAPQQEQNKAEAAVSPAITSPVACNSALPYGLPESGLERAMEERDRGEDGEAQSLPDPGVTSFDDQEVDVVALAEEAVLETCSIVGIDNSAQNGDEGAGLLPVKGGSGSVEVATEEVAGDGNGREMANRASAGGGELERKANGGGNRTKRGPISPVYPPPKRRAVSAVRRFPPGCGRAADTTKNNGVLKVSPERSCPPGCGRAAATTADNVVLDVSPIRSYPQEYGRSPVTTTDSGEKEGLPVEDDALAAVPVSGGDASNEKFKGKRLVDEGYSNADSRIQIPDDSVGAKRDGDVQQNVVPKAAPRHGFDRKMKGEHSPREGKQVAQAVMDHKMKNKLGGGFQKSNLETPLSGSLNAKAKGKILESNKMNVPLFDNAEASIEGNMENKTLSAKRELACSNVNTNQDKFACKLKGYGIGKDNFHGSTKESKNGKRDQTKESGSMNLVPGQLIVQALMAPDKCPWTRGRKTTTGASKSRAPRNKLKGNDATPRKLLLDEVASREPIDDDTIGDDGDTNKVTSNIEDEDNPMALVVYEDNREPCATTPQFGLSDHKQPGDHDVDARGREICIITPPSVPSGSHDMQLGYHNVDARNKVRKLLQLFQALCRKLMQVEEQGKHNFGRIDLEAVKALKKDPIYTKLGPIVGNIPGVEVGDEFHFRVELSIVGLHRPYQGGIDTSKVNGIPIALSIVASGGYPDELSSSDELIYTGSGGKASGKKEDEDQKLERGNLALKNCIETRTPVRVIHGFKGQSRGDASNSKGKQTSTFTYDGLYVVVDCWQEGPKGSMVFKYKLQRIPGQPELALHAVKATRKSQVREGLCLPDISQGRERIPVCVINTIDDMRPAPFKYITQVIYPPWYDKEPPRGCNCTNGCKDSVKCACAVKNGGEIPFNFNGAIVEAKNLIYECGPLCRCPPTCHNRVSQHGVKIPLEIFKTGKTGWGVRSLSSISSGSFICEYTGELLEDKEAEKRENDEYLFDIGSNYHDEELWGGLKSATTDLQSSTSASKTMEGFTIDAAECGSVGRFINHSCSPNLYAQNVLWDHDDMRMPHVMLFAVENIPPLQELTYHYNYKVGEVRDENGKEKIKHCYCGSSDCTGRLY